MKLLIVSPFFPYPPDSGGAIRIYNLIKHLSKEHDIMLLSYIDETQNFSKIEISTYCKAVTIPLPHNKRSWLSHGKHLFSKLPYSLVYVDNRFKERLIEITSQPFDIVQFEFLPLAHYVELLPKSSKKIVVEHYIAAESRKRLMEFWKPSLRKLYYRLQLPKINAYEQEILDKFDLCLITSEAHKQKLIDWGVKSQIMLSPNGVDTEYFAPLSEDISSEEPNLQPTLVYMGAYHLEPANIDGLTYLLENILPLIREKVPNIQLEIIGKGLPPHFEQKYRNNNIVFHGYVDDIRPVLGRAHGLLLSLRGGSGTKIRILTAMAMAIPVVATSIAAEGIDVKHNENILIGDTPENFSAETIKLIRDPELNSKIGSAGRKLVESKYSWKMVAERLNDIYTSL